jgi:accessory colonization factor AcfC
MAHSIIYDQYTPGGPHSQITTVAAIYSPNIMPRNDETDI